MPSTGSSDDLLSRLRYLVNSGKKRIAFVVGSGLTRGTVTGVEAMVRAMRSALEDDGDARRFDVEVNGAEWGARYQQAADFLIRNRDQDLLNRVIRLAVLSACRSLPPVERRLLVDNESKLRSVELDGSWALDPAVHAFGEILAGLPGDVRGPVITTNFDPLIEVSVRMAGGNPNVQYFDSDGSLISPDLTGTVDIAHVHGFWRRGDTLHTVHQLTSVRPLLDGSLREALRGHVVVVMGYSGWADAFSKSLLARVKEGQNLGMDLIWCSFHALTTESFRSGLFNALDTPGRTTFYSPVDLNHALPTLSARLPPKEAGAGAGGLRGWTRITSKYLRVRADACSDLEGHRARYFDGAEPDWATVMDSQVPRLSLATQLVDAISTTMSHIEAAPFVVGVGLLGEGKSSAIRQSVAEAASRFNAAQIFWREPGTRLDVKQVMALPEVTGRTYLLASDDGDLLIDDLRALSGALSARGRHDIRFVGVAQERDWRNAGGFVRLSNSAKVLRAGGLSTGDATAVVAAWATLGTPGLGSLASIDAAQRAEALSAAAKDVATGAPESLLGAMLQVRYGGALVGRVGDLLSRLDNYGSVGTSSLVECFLMVALMHTAGRAANGNPAPISRRILAEACSLSEATIDYLVLEPLGAEAAISRHSDDVWVRHEAIAKAALTASRARDPQEVVMAIRRLVRASVLASPLVGGQGDDLYAAAYISRELKEAGEAIAAADAAASAQPNRLSYVVSRVTAHRIHGDIQAAIAMAEHAWLARSSMADPDGEDALLTAWATACGMANDPAANVLLDAECLSRYVTEPSKQQAIRALLGMGVGLTTLYRQTGNVIFAQALAGVVALLDQAALRGSQANWRRTHQRTCEEIGVDPPVADPWAPLQVALETLDSMRRGWAEPLKSMTVSFRVVS